MKTGRRSAAPRPGRESAGARAQRAGAILARLKVAYPDARCALDHADAYQLLVATILSAQCTDARVNLVTPPFFARYPTPEDLARAEPAEVEALIRSTGFFRNKTRSLIGMAQALVAEHDGEVPADMETLTALPGVGRKTANVVLGHALGVPGLPVDRHVLRVSNRIGIAEGDDPVKVEAQLCRALPKETWTLASDVQILHGRRVCKPKPLCDICSVRDDCDYYRNVVSKARAPKARKVSVGLAARATRKHDPPRVRKARR